MTQTHIPIITSNAIVRNSLIFASAATLLGIGFASAVGVVGVLLLASDLTGWIVGGIILGTALGVSALLKAAWEHSRWVLVESIAVEIDKKDAEADKIYAEAGRIDAEAEAIKGANNVNIQTVNAGEGSRIKANLTVPKVRLASGAQMTWNQVNELSAESPEPRRLEFPREDVLWMLEQFVKVKHSKRIFTSEALPYSKLPAYPDLYNELMRVLVAADAIQGRSDRTAGKLVIKNINKLAKIVDTEYPKGVILELSPALPETVENLEIAQKSSPDK